MRQSENIRFEFGSGAGTKDAPSRAATTAFARLKPSLLKASFQRSETPEGRDAANHSPHNGAGDGLQNRCPRHANISLRQRGRSDTVEPTQNATSDNFATPELLRKAALLVCQRGIAVLRYQNSGEGQTLSAEDSARSRLGHWLSRATTSSPNTAWKHLDVVLQIEQMLTIQLEVAAVVSIFAVIYAR